MFSPDIKSNVIFPSLYLLFKFQNLAKLGLFLKEGVETFVFKGADVMWPGVSHVNVEEFTQNDMVVVYAQESKGDQLNFFPVAVGKMTGNGIPSSMKGKAIQVEHFLFDELWNMGDRKMPI